MPNIFHFFDNHSISLKVERSVAVSIILLWDLICIECVDTLQTSQAKDAVHTEGTVTN